MNGEVGDFHGHSGAADGAFRVVDQYDSAEWVAEGVSAMQTFSFLDFYQHGRLCLKLFPVLARVRACALRVIFCRQRYIAKLPLRGSS